VPLWELLVGDTRALDCSFIISGLYFSFSLVVLILNVLYICLSQCILGLGT
jgi:hypothetical protein